MKTTRGIERLLADAYAAGYTVERHAHSIRVLWRGKTGRILNGITISEDGTCVRCDIEFHLCRNIRTLRERRRLLGLDD